MDQDLSRQLIPGARARVTQQIAGGNFSWQSVVEGVVVGYAQQETGSWFAHSRDNRLWLDRLVLRKDDGEITTLNLDRYSVIEVTGAPQPPTEPQTKTESDAPA